MTLQEWKAQQGLGRGTASAPPSAPAASAVPEEDLTPGPLGEMRHATQGDDYTSAFEGEALRTAKEAGIGLLRSPLDLVKGVANTVVHPLDTLMGLGHTIAHPVEAVTNLAKNPREAGSLLGQMLLAPKVPGAANTALAEGPSLVGRGVAAVGRGAEALGKSKAVRGASKLGAVGSALHGNIPGVLAGLAPDALEMTGRGLQRGGAALQGLDLSLGKNPVPPVELIPESRRLNPARVSTETRDFGREMDSNAGSWERSPSDNPMVPGRRNPSIKGLDAAMDAGDKSAIEQFYKNDPQARGVGGEIAEGRTTGKFPEGKFGLNNLEANTPYQTPGSDGFYNNEFGPDEAFRELGTEDSLSGKPIVNDPAQSLAELSAKMGGRGEMSSEEASALFNKRFGLKQPTIAETKFPASVGGR